MIVGTFVLSKTELNGTKDFEQNLNFAHELSRCCVVGTKLRVEMIDVFLANFLILNTFLLFCPNRFIKSAQENSNNQIECEKSQKFDSALILRKRRKVFSDSKRKRKKRIV